MAVNLAQTTYQLASTATARVFGWLPIRPAPTLASVCGLAGLIFSGNAWASYKRLSRYEVAADRYMAPLNSLRERMQSLSADKMELDKVRQILQASASFGFETKGEPLSKLLLAAHGSTPFQNAALHVSTLEELIEGRLVGRLDLYNQAVEWLRNPDNYVDFDTGLGGEAGHAKVRVIQMKSDSYWLIWRGAALGVASGVGILLVDLAIRRTWTI